LSSARERALDALVLTVAKVAVGAWVLRQGFTHVSDDDYARTVIAEQLAHAPRLDPSGTSWLPLPFWLEGAVMMVAGRTLGVARTVAVVLGAVSVAAPYLAMRVVGVRRGAAIVATAVAMALPWNAWLGVATVPEGWFGPLVAGAVIAMGHDDEAGGGASGGRARAWAACALLAASLSRYEAWPACAVMAGLCAWRVVRGQARARRAELGYAAVAVAGPVAWMAWNARAHGSALHFLARVSTFRQAIGAADVPLGEKLLAYPRALVVETPEVAVLGAVGLVALAGLGPAPFRARWRWAAGATLAIVAFLVWGDVHDGAPTHHPARALASVWWVLVGMGVDAVATLGGALSASRRAVVAAAASLAGLAWCAWLPARWADSPGRSAAEHREAPIARGLDLRARGVAHVEVTPCAFEHFALLAAWGAPERATVHPRTGAPVTAECPLVDER
jgi:hypothetical protein